MRQRPCAKKMQLGLAAIVEGLGAASRALSVQRRRMFSVEVVSPRCPRKLDFFHGFLMEQ